jgi:hypothetical protein
MANQLFTFEEYIVFPVKNGYVVYNTNKEFKDGHTHLRNFKSCVDLIRFTVDKKIPRRCSNYYLRSLIRISDDEEYRKKVEELILVRKQKGIKQGYINKPCVIR